MILYLLFHRQYNPEELYSKLSFEEEEILIQEWRPMSLATGNQTSSNPSFVVRWDATMLGCSSLNACYLSLFDDFFILCFQRVVVVEMMFRCGLAITNAELCLQLS
jgi:hypothetical protein